MGTLYLPLVTKSIPWALAWSVLLAAPRAHGQDDYTETPRSIEAANEYFATQRQEPSNLDELNRRIAELNAQRDRLAQETAALNAQIAKLRSETMASDNYTEAIQRWIELGEYARAQEQANALRARADYTGALSEYSKFAEFMTKESPNYWIGVRCVSAGDDVLSFLELEQGTGLLVEQVLPNSPAEAVGIRAKDVILSVNGEGVVDISALAAAVDASEGEPIQLVLQRFEEQIELQVTPELREQRTDHAEYDEMSNYFRDYWRSKISEEAIRELMSKARENQQAVDQYWDLAASEWDYFSVDIPDNVEVCLSQCGNEPVKVTVQRDSEAWTASLEEMNDLPEDVRVYAMVFVRRVSQSTAQQMYEHAWRQWSNGDWQKMYYDYWRARAKAQQDQYSDLLPRETPPDASVQEQLDQLREMIKQLQADIRHDSEDR